MQAREQNMVETTKKPVFTGVATALCTPFSGGEVSLDIFREMIERQIDAGVSALVVCGTTGEAPTLTDREKLKLITCAVETAAGRVPIIAGTGSPCTDKMLRLSASARDAGVDALLIVTPYYNRGTEDGVLRYYETAAELGPPVILYNVPSRTGGDLSVPLLRRLSRHENIVALKEAAPVAKMAAVLADPECDLRVYSGNDADTLPALVLGAAGAVSVISNILPRHTTELCGAFFRGDTETARKEHTALLPLARLLFEETSSVPVMYLCGMLGICPAETRLPLGTVSETLAKKLESAYWRICPSGEEK